MDKKLNGKSEEKKDLLIQPPGEADPEIVRGEWNTNSLPLVLPRTRQNSEKRNQPIIIDRYDEAGGKIGTVKMSRRLTAGQYKFYEELTYLFSEMGCPESNTVFDSLNAVMRDLYSKKKKIGQVTRKYHAGKFDKKWVKKTIDALQDTSIQFKGCFELGKKRLSEDVSYFLLERSLLYEEDKEDQEFSLSMFKFPDYVAQNIRSGRTIPMRLDVIVNLKGDLAIALYPFINRMLYANGRFQKDLKDVCEELVIDFKYGWDMVRYFRKACRELVGKELSGPGRIFSCEIVPSETPSGYKLVAVRGERRSIEKKPETPAIEAKKKNTMGTDEGVEKEKREERLYYAFFQKLHPDDQKKIEEMIPGVIKKHGRFWKDNEFYRTIARLEAIKIFYERQVTYGAVETAKAAEAMVGSPDQAPYNRTDDAHLDRYTIKRIAIAFWELSRVFANGSI